MNSSINQSTESEKLTTIFLFICLLFSTASFAQESIESSDFKYGQYVMVTLKSGSEVPAKILYVKSSNKYRVKMIGGNRIGEVHKKYIRSMTEDEILKLTKRKQANSDV